MDIDSPSETAWFYDREFLKVNTKQRVDDVLLRVYRNGQLMNPAPPDSQKFIDEKIRYKASQKVGGGNIMLKFNGISVTNNDTVCGDNAVLMYYAIFAEDTDRDDVRGPLYDPTTCTGVAP